EAGAIFLVVISFLCQVEPFLSKLPLVIKQDKGAREAALLLVAVAQDGYEVFSGPGVTVDLHFDVAGSVKEMGSPYVVAGLLFYFHRSGACWRSFAIIIVIGGI